MKKNRTPFFSSVHFKIALVFVLLLMISIEIVGAIFIRVLETSTIQTFEENVTNQVETLATNLSSEISKKNDSQQESNLKRILDEFSKNEILEVRLVDDKGIVMATSDPNLQGDVGKKNDYELFNSFNQKKEERTDPKTGQRVFINIEQIYSPTGDTVIGSLYVKSNIESKYQQVSEITLIFFYASMIALIFTLIIALLVSRTITKPIGEMKQQADRIANGDYSGQVEVYGKDELGQLGETFNELSYRVKETQETMDAERRRLDSVLTHMSDGVIGTDRRGNIILINDTALNLLRIGTEDVINQSILELLKLGDKYSFRDLLEVQEDVLLDFSEDFSETTLIRAEFSMIRRESGFISGLVCVLHDVTKKEKDEEERRQFVSNVSHELRTPLTSMKSYIEALLDGAWQDSEVAPQFLKVTQEETNRMIRMINDLLQLSRMDANKIELQKELVHLNELFNYVLDRFDMVIKDSDRNYVIKREFTQRAIWVDIDTDRMIQVLDNILNNAMKYSPDGGTITCRLLETHKNVVLSISDEGLGIPKQNLGRVFDRFFRVDKARSRAMGGSGLGLAISKESILAHGGNIWAESEENKGSTFFISLPYEPYEEDLWE
ncbi:MULTISPECIES: cell wall metabolism sensor histidine kinase WalK [Enterococcaceae]|uniref:cell wall metabolism sensor histidine kinase WalK n=1 Tax=Enterococcaceae TaxID=81852 RepID=UPI000E4BA0F2|nr:MULTISPECIES: cell wall metabolism sensor histidine kinase WalK [Enterococcaceae]MCI0131077.1 cell wall metabolism sensor histidine kinase WalK [Vagococcus sp. CY53-2]RGI29690.1 cell wall metabolism sensor histidine kinase WalK [Melissococcus sp. OM08-11BH]UNM89699.1 cell wall metabolism sensor histidine kinase WalK [Vagococcus sp. CY52-2]